MVEAKSQHLDKIEERWQHFFACMFATVVNCWAKDPIKASQLLGGDAVVLEMQQEQEREKQKIEHERKLALLEKRNKKR